MRRNRYFKPKRHFSLPSRFKGINLRINPRKLKLILGSSLVIFILLYFVLLRPFFVVYAGMKDFKSGGRDIAKHLKEKDFKGISKDFDKMEKVMNKIDKVAKNYSYLSFIPGTSAYFQDAGKITQAGVHGVNMARLIFQALESEKDVLGFVGGGEEGKEVNKLVSAMRVMPAILPKYDEIAAELHQVRLVLDTIDPNNYPKSIKGYEIRSLLEFAQQMVRQFDDGSPSVKAFLGKMPEFMGDAGTGDRTYLILFQNDKELRASGGFLTSYALLTLREGNVADVISADTFDLDQRIGLITPPHPVLSRFLMVDHWFARDANFSPDYVESAKMFYDFWQMVPNPKIDGIFALDTEVPSELLKVLGPVKIAGFEEDVNSENVVDLMSERARGMREQAGRKALIGLVMSAMEGKIFDAPQEQWGPMFSTVLKLLYEKHLLLYSFDPEIQSFFEAFNYAGRVRDYPGDYLYVNDTNLAGGKANFFIEQTVTKETREENGRLVSDLTVHYKNTGEFAPEINPGYQDYVRIYIPKGSELISSSGSQEAVAVQEDLGKTMIVAVNLTAPKEESELKFTYRLPEGIKKDGYSILVQKQPGKPNDTYTVGLGKRKEEFEIRSDKELHF